MNTPSKQCLVQAPAVAVAAGERERRKERIREKERLQKQRVKNAGHKLKCVLLNLRRNC